MLAYQTGCRCPRVKGIIATCILDQRDSYITRKTAIHPVIGVIGNAFIRIAHRFMGNNRIPMKMVANMKAIANNKGLSALLMRDKRSSGTSVPIFFLYTMLNPKIEIEPQDFSRCPFLLVHPQLDQWTDISLSKRFFDRLSCKKELRILEGAGHFPIEETGLKQLEEYCVAFINENLEIES